MIRDFQYLACAKGDIMKKSSIGLIILILLFVSCLVGKTKEINAAKPDSVKFKLMSALSHNLLISCPNLESRIFFIDDMLINTSDLTSKKVCTFLNRDFNISEVFVNGNAIPIRQYLNLKPENFEPIIRVQEFETLNKQCVMYELILKDLQITSDTTRIRIKYYTNEQDSLKNFKTTDGMVEMKGTSLWYPRNINHDENISLTIKTTDQISAYLDGKYISFTKDKYLKEYKAVFVDLMEKPASLLFRKTELK